MTGDVQNILGKEVTITMDRPVGTRHPKHPDIIYPINYGYVEGIMGGDGEEQDCYLLGVSEPVETYRARVVAVIHRLDDVEDKWVAAPDGYVFSREDIRRETQFQERFYHSELYCLHG